MAGSSPYQQPDDPVHDFGPWVETASSRCSRYRYDYATKDMQVKWRNGRGHVVTTYLDAGGEIHRRFARSASKGKFVNRNLNTMTIYRPSTPDEVNAPSNPNRSAVQHLSR